MKGTKADRPQKERELFSETLKVTRTTSRWAGGVGRRSEKPHRDFRKGAGGQGRRSVQAAAEL